MGGPEITRRTRTVIARNLRRNATDAERILWHALRTKGTPWKFRRQHPIGRFMADFACPACKLVIELDGGQHAIQQVADASHSAEIARYGYRVLRFWNNEVLENLDGVLHVLLDALGRPELTGPAPHRSGRGER